jgi:uncharacterized membrane protein
MWVPGQEAIRPVVTAPASTPAIRVPATVVPPTSSSVQAKDKLIGALAYVTFIPAVVFVLIEPFKRNRFVRFHSFQSMFFTVATIVVAIALWIVYAVVSLIPVIGFLLGWLALALVLLGWVILWLVVLVKASQGTTFRLPFIGGLAEKA